MMNKLSVVLVKKSVNGKSLASIIETFLVEAIEDILNGSRSNGNWTGRDWFVELMDAFMYDLSVEGKIVQWDIICDARNNKISNLDTGKLHIDVYYKQYDCVNTTHFSYTLSNESQDNDEDNYDIFN